MCGDCFAAKVVATMTGIKDSSDDDDDEEEIAAEEVAASTYAPVGKDVNGHKSEGQGCQDSAFVA